MIVGFLLVHSGLEIVAYAAYAAFILDAHSNCLQPERLDPSISLMRQTAGIDQNSSTE